MWVEAKKDLERKRVKEFFDGKKIYANQREYTIIAYDSGLITADGISRSGINSQHDADEMTGIGFEFYELLKNAPTFRYALTGVEVDGFAYYEELVDDPEFHLKIKGFVIQKELYAQINGKRKMVSFSEGYLWTPYEGETWNSQDT